MLELPHLPPCTTDDDCPRGYVCVAGVCQIVPECTDDSQCPSGYACQDGECVEGDGSPSGGCSVSGGSSGASLLFALLLFFLYRPRRRRG